MIRGRRDRRGSADGGEAEPEALVINASELSRVLATPSWLRDLGVTAWLLVGVFIFVAGIIWLLALTDVIVGPLIAAAVIAAVAGPLVSWMARHHVPRPIGAILVLAVAIALGVFVVYLVIAGITSQIGDLRGHLDDAKRAIEGGLKGLGVDPSEAEDATREGSSSSTDAVQALLNGVAVGLKNLSSLLFFLAMTALSLLFLLADGPRIRAWGERHMGVPLPVAQMVTSRTLQSLRGYFLGVTIVAAFNAVVVGLGALALGVPLAGSLAVITFFAAYIPYLGAWTAGALAVLIALGGAGTDAAIGMTIVEILANGALQQLVQPFAMGAALGIHPLAVFVVTIAGGALFGTVGLVLSAPVTSALTRISADLAKARTAEETRGPPDAPAEPNPDAPPREAGAQGVASDAEES
jgi:putative heme transporter